MDIRITRGLLIVAAALPLASCGKPHGDDAATKAAAEPAAAATIEPGPIRIVGVRIITEKTGPFAQPFLEVEVRNIGAHPALLGTNTTEETVCDRLVRLRRVSTPPGAPFLLGLEKRYSDETVWRWVGEHRYFFDKRPEDRLLSIPPQAVLTPDEQRTFACSLPVTGYRGIAWRAYLLDASGGRIDEVTLGPGESGPVAKDVPPSETSAARDFSADGPGRIEVIITSEEGMKVPYSRNLKRSNSFNRKVRIAEGRTQVCVEDDESGASHWEDYTPAAKDFVIPYDVDVEIRRVDDLSLADTASLMQKDWTIFDELSKRTGFSKGPLVEAIENILKGEGKSLGGYVFTSAELPPGRYHIIALTTLQRETTDEITDPVFEYGVGGDGWQRFLQSALDLGLYQGRTGADDFGLWEIIDLQPTSRTDPESPASFRTGAKVTKRYTYTIHNAVQTLVSAKTGYDMAMLTLLSDAELAARRCQATVHQKGLPQTPGTMEEACDTAVRSVATATIQKYVASELLEGRLGPFATSALVSMATVPSETLLTPEFWGKMALKGFAKVYFTKVVGLSAGYGAAAAVLVVVAADAIVSHAQHEVIRALADTDDLVLRAGYDCSNAMFTLKVESYGPDLYDVRLQPKGTLPSATMGRGAGMLRPGQSTWLSTIAAPDKWKDLKLVYCTRPCPGQQYEYRRSLDDLAPEDLTPPKQAAKRAFPLVILDVQVEDAALDGPFANEPHVRIIAEVQNTSGEPVWLHARDFSGRKFSSLEELDLTRREGRPLPVGLGIEARYDVSQGWGSYLYARGWAKLDADRKPAALGDDVRLAPGQTCSFATMAQADSVPPQLRVFLLTPELLRIDEKLLLFGRAP
ncbi:MAG: hypothetical protein HQ582_06785 [Planctomycetes bacterium]|nr:hypothetical protein [Planctomycetota bacterium]